jgi:hypothetical protein
MKKIIRPCRDPGNHLLPQNLLIGVSVNPSARQRPINTFYRILDDVGQNCGDGGVFPIAHRFTTVSLGHRRNPEAFVF